MGLIIKILIFITIILLKNSDNSDDSLFYFSNSNDTSDKDTSTIKHSFFYSDNALKRCSDRGLDPRSMAQSIKSFPLELSGRMKALLIPLGIFTTTFKLLFHGSQEWWS